MHPTTLVQYFVEPPYLAVTDAKLLEYAFTSFEDLETQILICFSYSIAEILIDWLGTISEHKLSSSFGDFHFTELWGLTWPL